MKHKLIIIILAVAAYLIYDHWFNTGSDSDADADVVVATEAQDRQSEIELQNQQRAIEVLEGMRQSSSFIAMNYYEEIVVSQTKGKSGFSKMSSTFFGNEAKAKIVLLVKGSVSTGFDLSKIEDEDINVSGSTLHLTLPASEIFDSQIVIDDMDVIAKEGSWSDEEIESLKQKSVEIFKTRISNSSIMNKSDRKGVEKLTKMYKSLGYSDVVCKINR